MSIQVKADLPEGKIGFFGGRRRRNGDIFSIDNEKQLGKWMSRVEQAPKKQAPKKQEG